MSRRDRRPQPWQNEATSPRFPPWGVIAEAMAAFVLADALLEKFGGDSLGEVRRNLDAYLARLDERVG